MYGDSLYYFGNFSVCLKLFQNQNEIIREDEEGEERGPGRGPGGPASCRRRPSMRSGVRGSLDRAALGSANSVTQSSERGSFSPWPRSSLPSSELTFTDSV